MSRYNLSMSTRAVRAERSLRFACTFAFASSILATFVRTKLHQHWRTARSKLSIIDRSQFVTTSRYKSATKHIFPLYCTYDTIELLRRLCWRNNRLNTRRCQNRDQTIMKLAKVSRMCNFLHLINLTFFPILSPLQISKCYMDASLLALSRFVATQLPGKVFPCFLREYICSSYRCGAAAAIIIANSRSEERGRRERPRDLPGSHVVSFHRREMFRT